MATCDIYRPYGSSTPVKTGVECTVITGRIGWAVNPAAMNPAPGWSHEVQFAPGVRLRYAARFNQYGTSPHQVSTVVDSRGDELRIGSLRLLVIWVLRMDDGTVRAFALRV